jgi:F420-non-reducing hydrogenase iron-sulfur subunit
MGKSPTIEPKLVAFCCKYCAYAAADLAGVLRLRYPPEIRILQIPCTGRLDILEVLLAFEHGADGIMVAGCLEGDCHFQRGNIAARSRVGRIKQLIEEVGIEPERVEMFNMSSAMGRQFAEAATVMAERIQELGPSPIRGEGKKNGKVEKEQVVVEEISANDPGER